MLSSMRLILLERAATLLRRWLRTVTTQLEPAAPPSVAPTPSPVPRAAASSRPAPPDHWVELVQQYAPHLLDPVDSVEPDATPSLDSVTGSDRKGTTGESHPIPGGN